MIVTHALAPSPQTEHEIDRAEHCPTRLGQLNHVEELRRAATWNEHTEPRTTLSVILRDTS